MATLYPDISHYHPVTDWTKIKKNCPFIISKATQGTSFIDSTLTTFINGCEKNKIPYWLYTYLNKGSELAQAKFLVSTCKNKVGDYFMGYVLDVEAGNTSGNIQKALDYLEGLGGKCMIYTMYTQYASYKNVVNGRGSNTAWWEARYGTNNGSYSSKYPPHSGVDLHQYTSLGDCSGVSGKADLNRLTGTKKESWFTGKTSTSTTSTSSSTSTSDTLTVDGVIGSKTVKKLQKVLGTTQDGKISGQYSNYKKYWTSVSSTVCSWSGGKSEVVTALQKKVGADQDGFLGKTTAKKLQSYLIKKGYSCGTSGANGYFGTESAKALQKWLNAQ